MVFSPVHRNVACRNFQADFRIRSRTSKTIVGDMEGFVTFDTKNFIRRPKKHDIIRKCKSVVTYPSVVFSHTCARGGIMSPFGSFAMIEHLIYLFLLHAS